jgi:hypothetical protein
MSWDTNFKLNLNLNLKFKLGPREKKNQKLSAPNREKQQCKGTADAGAPADEPGGARRRPRAGSHQGRDCRRLGLAPLPEQTRRASMVVQGRAGRQLQCQHPHWQWRHGTTN